MKNQPQPSTDLSFDKWMRLVDAIIARKAGGLTSADLPDYCYRDDYDDDTAPITTASRAVRAACYD